jgi:hypothetical protein
LGFTWPRPILFKQGAHVDRLGLIKRILLETPLLLDGHPQQLISLEDGCRGTTFDGHHDFLMPPFFHLKLLVRFEFLDYSLLKYPVLLE